MKSKPHIPSFSAENAMPENYAHDLAERVIQSHTATKPKPASLSLALAGFGAAAALLLLLGAFYLWNLLPEPPSQAESSHSKDLEAYLWNEEQPTEADLLLVLTGAESDDFSNQSLELDPLIFN
jgi:hypothetical protein